MPAPRILELGAKRSIADRSTVHKDWVPHSAEFLGSDIEPAEDVDVLADVHRLSEFVGAESFDAIISCSSFEHFKYPHLAAHEIMKTLKVGGALFIQTHQSYPLHSSPFDYFRFSREAMAGLFGTKMGFNVIGTDYEFPVRLRAKEAPDIAFMPAYINVRLFGEKTAPTPAQYIYEFDTSL
jgi:SAM-dependent methyltransferase